MKHHGHFGFGRFFSPPDDRSGHHNHHDGHHGGHHGRGRRGRLFDYGDLRLLMLAMIAEAPSHGYELIKSIEEKFGGAYAPSPGVVYPTLAWLDDMGYARVEPVEGGRKRYRITPEGEAFLTANRDLLDARVGDQRARFVGEAGIAVEPPQESVRIQKQLHPLPSNRPRISSGSGS